MSGSTFLATFDAELLNTTGRSRAFDSMMVMLASYMAIIEHFKDVPFNFAKIRPLKT